MRALAIQNFRYGLDVRRLEETTQPGALVVLNNAHITSGGEIEKRKAFVAVAKPTDMFGLESTDVGLMAFGSKVEGSLSMAVPGFVTYQRLIAEETTALMTKVVWSCVFAGKAFVIAEYDNGLTHVFYDGVLVRDFTSGVVSAILAGDNAALAGHLADLIGDLTSSYSSSLSGAEVTLISPAGLHVNVTSDLTVAGDGTLPIVKSVTAVIGTAGSYARGQFSIHASEVSAGVNRVASILVGSTQLLAVYNVTARERTSDVATLTTSVAHGLTVGQTLSIVGMSDAEYDEASVVAAAGTTGSTIVYANPGSSGDEASTGETSGLAGLAISFINALASPETTAAALVDAINARSSTSGFEASVQDATVFVQATTVGTAANSAVLTVRVIGAVCVGQVAFELKTPPDATAMVAVTAIYINGLDVLDDSGTNYPAIIGGSATSLSELAEFIADNIRSKSASLHTAVAIGSKVYLSRFITSSDDTTEEVTVIVDANGGIGGEDPVALTAYGIPTSAVPLFGLYAATTDLYSVTSSIGAFVCRATGGEPPYTYQWSIGPVTWDDPDGPNQVSFLSGTSTSANSVQIQVSSIKSNASFTLTCTVQDTDKKIVTSNAIPVQYSTFGGPK